MYSENNIAGMQNEAELVNILKKYIPLKESRRALKGNCPFHDDSMTSLMVLPEKSIFKCFGCGKEGDLIDLISLMENKSA